MPSRSDVWGRWSLHPLPVGVRSRFFRSLLRAKQCSKRSEWGDGVRADTDLGWPNACLRFNWEVYHGWTYHTVPWTGLETHTFLTLALILSRLHTFSVNKFYSSHDSTLGCDIHQLSNEYFPRVNNTALHRRQRHIHNRWLGSGRC